MHRALLSLHCAKSGAAIARGFATRSPWAAIEAAPADPILGLTEAFKKDEHALKVNLGVGAYRDDRGLPYVLGTVREAERRIVDAKLDHEYVPIAGSAEFNSLAAQLIYGVDSPALSEKRVAMLQAISGTGACRVLAEFMSRFAGPDAAIHLPTPTWGNHIPIMKYGGLQVQRYRYYNQSSPRCLDFAGMVEDVREAPEGSVFLLHACAHNPTGVDPTQEQWKELSGEFARKGHMPVFDCAYQGFASGDADADAFAIRQFVADGHFVAVAQSFAKNFGLYGQRVGTLSLVTASAEERERVESQLKMVARPMYSSPPKHGALIVQTILKDAQLRAQWFKECAGMADRIKEMRTLLRGKLEALTGRDWSHITDQIGMFCFTGLTPQQVGRLVKEKHVYLTSNGRISMAGVTTANVDYVAESIKEVMAEPKAE